MTGQEQLVWESYSDLYGTTVPMDTIIEDLKQFSCPSILLLCSYISVKLQLGVWGEEFDQADYLSLLSTMFPKQTAELLRNRLSSQVPQRRVFHRRLLLLTAKLAIIHCRFTGPDAAIAPESFGHIFLKLNDHFDFRAAVAETRSADLSAQLRCVLLHTLGMKEFSNSRHDFALVRSWRMCKLIPRTLAEHPDYVDIDELFRRGIGIDYATFEALTVGAATKYTKVFRSPVSDSPLMTILLDGFLTGGILPIEQVHAFLGEVSGHISILELEARKSPSLNNDLSLFRKYPFVNLAISLGKREPMLVHLLLDQDLLFEKVVSTPYWTGVRNAPNGFPRFWGAIFEQHIGGILEETCKGGPATYIHSPRLPAAANHELCDGLMVSGNALVLLEYKSSILTAKGKYSGDPIALGEEIRKKLVRDEETGRPKAAAQLANAAKTLLDVSKDFENPWFQRSRIERCYAVVITLDDIGGAGGISALLNVDFESELSGSTLCCEVRPLFCIDAESLEVCSSVFSRHSLANILEQWFSQDPGLMRPLSDFCYAGPLKPPKWFEEDRHALVMRVARILIDPATLASDPAFQKTVSHFDGAVAEGSEESGSIDGWE